MTQGEPHVASDDAWLVRKQAEYLQEAVTMREVSLELLECISTLAKELVSQAETAKDLQKASVRHLVQRTKGLLTQSSEITGIILHGSPNEMLQQELGGLPNVAVTLPPDCIFVLVEKGWKRPRRFTVVCVVGVSTRLGLRRFR
jgi:hypothetical protein